ncbi:hypothetical protein [Microbispora hainanensis]|uniref:hypothetical protein n=1 Tax=Microbispora hainanensis TaxID=568844 RepID=UPI003AF35F2B
MSAGGSVDYSRRQVRDIPLVTVTVTEHRAHRCRCRGCGRLTSADMPVGVAGAPSVMISARASTQPHLLMGPTVPGTVAYR